jgi:hypothetical protein
VGPHQKDPSIQMFIGKYSFTESDPTGKQSILQAILNILASHIIIVQTKPKEQFPSSCGETTCSHTDTDSEYVRIEMNHQIRIVIWKCVTHRNA